MNISALTTVQGIFTTGGVYNAAANLASGAQIGPSYANIANGYTFRTLYDFYGATGFAGVQFNIAGQPHYAWLRLALSPLGDSLTIVDWAYEDQANTPIAAGAVATPEPGSGALMGLGLLALGARGVRHRRKRLADLEKAGEAPTR